ncbi:HNH endonuclease [Rhizobium ruizarguesonis]
MWEIDPKIFSTRFQVPGRAVLLFRCTAEHLQARCDGGLDTEENVVAACQYCNRNRHRTKRPKDAASYASFVQSRLERGRWNSISLTHSPAAVSMSDACARFIVDAGGHPPR